MDLTFPLSSTTILQLAQLCPLHLSPTDRPLLQQEREPFPLPIPPSSSPCGALPSSDQSPNAIIIHPRHTSSGSLTFSGLGSHLWAAQDCGDFLSFGTGLSRANSCVFLAIGSSLSIQPDVLATQVRREAALFRASLPVPLPSHLSELSSQALMHLHDLFTINHPIDPVSLALWSPSCLRHRHLIFVQCNSPTTAVRVVSLSATVDPSKVPLRSAGFVLLYRRHAWCLSPPEAIRSLSLATWKHLLAPSEDIFSHLPFGHWRSFLPLSSPPPPTYPWPPLAPCSFCSSPSWSFGGGVTFANNVLSDFQPRFEPNRFAALLHDINLSLPTQEEEEDNPIGRYWNFVDSNPPYSTENWKKMVMLCETVIAKNDYDLGLAIHEIRRYKHPGRVVEERTESSFLEILNQGVIPQDLHDLLQDRFIHGTPSAFEDQPPSRQGPDKMHTSAAQHIGEVLELVWSEVSTGKTILISASFRETFFPTLPNSPIARIPKYDAKGVERPKGRVIRNHSFPHGLSINSAVKKPPNWPIILPTIWMLLHDIEYLKRVAPNVPILICKRDVHAAFEWCGLHEDLVQYMGSYVEDVNNDGFGDTFVFPMRATFGYLLSPSEWAIHGNGIDILNAAAVPKVPRRDGPWVVFARSYVDDYMILIPDVGLRRWISPQIVEDNMKRLLGPTAINEKKNAEEGGLDVRGVLLGFEINTESEIITVSAEKLEKARRFVGEKVFDWGNKRITKRDVQKLIGRLIYLGVVCRAVQVFVNSCINLITKDGPFHKQSSSIFFKPDRLADDPSKRDWCNFWNDLRWIRHILNKDILTTAPLSAPFVTVLHPVIRYEQARNNDRFVMLGTDATQWSCAAIRYDENLGIRFQLQEEFTQAFEETLSKNSSAEELKATKVKKKGRHITMGITELMAVLGSLLVWQEDFKNALVVVIIDNANALSWIRSRTAKNHYAQALLRILGRLEIRYRTTIWAEEIRSEENELPDCLSRLKDRFGNPQVNEFKRWKQLIKTFGKQISYQDLEPPFPIHWFKNMNDSEWDLVLPDEELPNYKVVPSAVTQQANHQQQLKPFASTSNKNTDASTPNTNPKETIPVLKVTLPTTLMSNHTSINLGRYGGLNCTEQELLDAVSYLDENILAERTRHKYEADFKTWSNFQEARARPIYLYDLPLSDCDADLRKYIAYIGVIKGLRHTTVTGHLSAIRYYHLTLGYGDPTTSTRVRALIKGLKRIQGIMIPKRPVTPTMLLHIKSQLNLSQIFDSYLWAGLLTGFVGMLRASEYLGESAETYDDKKVLLTKNVRFTLMGKYTTEHSKADEVEIYIRGSKTDQYGEGVFRAFKSQPTSDLCIVKALQHLWLVAKPSQGNRPLFWIPGRGMITRGFISETLKRTAMDLGETTTGMSSHSLRGGGATTLYAAGYTIEQVMHLGRWLSNSWLRYVKMSRRVIDKVNINLTEVEVELVDYPARRRNSTKGQGDIRPNPTAVTSLKLQLGDAWYVEGDRCTYAIIRTGKRKNVDKPVYYYAPTEYWEQVKLKYPEASPKEWGKIVERSYTVQYSLLEEVHEEWVESKRENIFWGGL